MDNRRSINDSSINSSIKTRAVQGGRLAQSRLLRVSLQLVLVAVICVSMIPLRSHISSDENVTEQARMLCELGLMSSSDDAFLARRITRGEAIDALNLLAGAGDASDAADYFRESNIAEAPDYIANFDGSRGEASSEITGVQLYEMALRFLGYTPLQYGETADSVMYNAAAAGYGHIMSVTADTPVTNGSLAVMMSEALMLRPYSGGTTNNEAVYRILARIKPSFRAALLAEGLYDDVPQELAVPFDKGLYTRNSYAALGNTWKANYTNVTREDFDTYITRLCIDGYWQSEGLYAYEGERPATAAVLYRLDSSTGTEREIGLVVRYYEDGGLEWALFA